MKVIKDLVNSDRIDYIDQYNRVKLVNGTLLRLRGKQQEQLKEALKEYVINNHKDEIEEKALEEDRENVTLKDYSVPYRSGELISDIEVQFERLSEGETDDVEYPSTAPEYKLVDMQITKIKMQ